MFTQEKYEYEPVENAFDPLTEIASESVDLIIREQLELSYSHD